MAQRSVWVDVAKGVAIGLVVFGHAWRSLDKKGLIPEICFQIVDDAIYAFHMPMFFMISGFFFFSRISQGASSMHAAQATRRLLMPLVLWTYLFLLLRWIFSDFTNAKPDFSSLFVLPVPGILHFWFLWALWLIQMGFLAFSAVFPARLKARYFLSASLFLASSVWSLGALLPFPTYFGAAYGHAIFFVAGAVLYRIVEPIRIGGAKTLAAASVFTGLILLTQTSGLSSMSAALLALGLSVSALVFVKGVSEAALPGLTLLQWMGVYSFAIYMMHTIFSAGIREILLAQGITSLSLHLCVGVIAGIIFPIGVSLIAMHYKCDRILGLSIRPPTGSKI